MLKKQEVWLCFLFGFKSKADKYWCAYKLVLSVVVLSVLMKEKTGLVLSVVMKEKTGLVVKNGHFHIAIQRAKSLGEEATTEVIPWKQDFELKWETSSNNENFQIAIERVKSMDKEVTGEIMPSKQDLELKWEHWCNITGLFKIALDHKVAFFDENWFSGQGLRVDPIDYICDICDEVLDIIKGCSYKCMSEILNYSRETSSKNANFHIAIERAKSMDKEVTAEVIPSQQDLELKWEHWCNTARLLKIALDLKEIAIERPKSLGKEVATEVIPSKQDLELKWEHWCNTSGFGIEVGTLMETSSKNRNFQIAIERAKCLGEEVTAEVIPSNQDFELKWETSSKNRNFQIAIERAKSLGEEVTAEVIPCNQDLELKWEH
ncbi:hypothetical protein JRO89_XS06G0222400 [Xanthoceras sorbifolium]|uniref:Uncharacterized protein n=1 Tax=Xanthoceras sorbifolium TaxID=99658 RepID=A0ABQ8HZA0_9ROSI|nr:hypothetical protein JRO89_XS06G0222400 [Xanthoceras sorbifolium]